MSRTTWKSPCPGNRKVFDRQWYEQDNPKAQEIGVRTLKQQAMSAGLMAKPVGDGSSELDFASWDAYATALVGQTVTVKTKQERAQTKNAAGKYVDAFLDADGETTHESTTNGMANTPKLEVVVAFYVVK